MDPGHHVLALDLLEVQLWVDVEPVGDLHDVEELEHEGHLVVGVAFPQLSDAEQVLSHDDVAGPHKADDVEAQELSTLIELGVLDLGQVELAVDAIKQVLLDDLVHYNDDQEIEEDSREILDAGRILDDVMDLSGGELHRHRDIVVQGDEERGQGRRHLEHEAHDEDHGHAGHDVGMVLDHELMAENGGILRAPPLDGHGGGCLVEVGSVMS